MLLGMAFFRCHLFQERNSMRVYWGMLATALVIGIPISAYGLHLFSVYGWDSLISVAGWQEINSITSVFVCLGWMAALFLTLHSGKLESLVRWLPCVGRMALTNYIAQSLICTTIFYGHGFGLFGRVGRFRQLVFVLGVWAIQIAFSNWWLRRFRFGPLEWFWRSLTYLRLQPIRG
jgi:uncharacterized protein